MQDFAQDFAVRNSPAMTVNDQPTKAVVKIVAQVAITRFRFKIVLQIQHGDVGYRVNLGPLVGL